MSDIQELIDLLVEFRDERDWGQFHDSKNLALALSIEAVTPMSEFSKGMVTRVSTSSGEKPGDSVKIVTVGLVKSGKTSTGSSVAVLMPRIKTTKAKAKIRGL